MVPYNGANIIIFRDDLGAVGDELLAPRKGAKSRREIIAGQPVSVEETEDPDPDVKDVKMRYLARPKPNVLIYATDRNYLAMVLERIASRARTRAIPADLPEWTHLDLSARFWCIRHYDRKHGPADPTSPFGQLRPAICTRRLMSKRSVWW